jgi:uncharacterized protein (TIGR00369 family)
LGDPSAGEIADIVDLLRAQTGRMCFACGPDNPIGIHLGDPKVDGTDITATFRPRHEYQGTSGSLHGGIAATVVDEIMVWAAILQERVLCVTGRMDIRYRKPLANDGEYLARARVDRRSGRRLEVSAEIEADGATAVSGSGLYLVSRPIDEEPAR